LSLSNIYTELHRQAERSGEDRAIELKGGARLAVRCTSGITTLTISRIRKQVGATELVVFRRECAIPTEAYRYPDEGQGTHEDAAGIVWHFVAYRWRDRIADDPAGQVTDPSGAKK
jgi:hypothetical protein